MLSSLLKGAFFDLRGDEDVDQEIDLWWKNASKQKNEQTNKPKTTKQTNKQKKPKKNKHKTKQKQKTNCKSQNFFEGGDKMIIILNLGT